MSRLLLAGLLILSAACVQAAERSLIDFEIEDQFEAEHSRAGFLGRPLLIIGSNRDGSAFNRLWSAQIKDSLAARGLAGRVTQIGLADMRGVPFFLKGFVRGKFPKEEAGPILMDWKGRFPQAYDFMPGESNLLVFDAEGGLQVRHHGKEPDDAGLARVLDAIGRCLSP